MTATITLSTSPANRKELAEAFGQNQSAVRRIESMTKDITVTLPDAIDGTGSIAQQALDLAQALQKVAYLVASADANVPNADVIQQGSGIVLTVGENTVTIALKVPVTVVNGGTGLQALEQYGVLIGNAEDTPNFAVPGAPGYVLTSNGANAVPSFLALPVTSVAAGTGIHVSSSGGTYTVSLQTPVVVANGGTGANSASVARANLGAAASGANSDITSLTGLTTPLATTEGGTGVATLTPYGVLVGNGGGPVGALTVGTAGQVLTSNGAGSNPSMQAIPSQAGRQLAVRTLTNGTYTATAGTTWVRVRMQAPGGAGGGTPATGSGQYAAGSCGGAGAYVEAWFAVAALAGQTVNLGTPGAGVSGAAGNAATAATFGSAISCPGGTGGIAGSILTTAGVTLGSSATAAPTVTGGTTLLSIPGIGGGAGVVYVPGTLQGIMQGGSSPIGQGSQPKWGAGSNVGQGYGWGGGGANAPASTAAQAGATGGNGWCEVAEFA